MNVYNHFQANQEPQQDSIIRSKLPVNLNLNKKAREELLEKKRAKEEQQKTEIKINPVDKNASSKTNSVNKSRKDEIKIKPEQVSAAYKGQLVALEYDDDEEDDEKIKQEEKSIVTLKPRQLQVNRDQNKPKPPILKAGQIQVNEPIQQRLVESAQELAKNAFIGPQLPEELLRTRSGNEFYESNQLYNSDEENEKSSNSSVATDGKKKELSFTKEELVKYENLSKMSQMYARYSQGNWKVFDVFEPRILG
jgi:hypothetical protein